MGDPVPMARGGWPNLGVLVLALDVRAARARRRKQPSTHNRTFAFLKDTCTRGIHDNSLRSALIPKRRLTGFLSAASEAVIAGSCRRAAMAWSIPWPEPRGRVGKGADRNRVGLLWKRLLLRIKVKSYDELNAWLLDRMNFVVLDKLGYLPFAQSSG